MKPNFGIFADITYNEGVGKWDIIFFKALIFCFVLTFVYTKRYIIFSEDPNFASGHVAKLLMHTPFLMFILWLIVLSFFLKTLSIKPILIKVSFVKWTLALSIWVIISGLIRAHNFSYFISHWLQWIEVWLVLLVIPSLLLHYSLIRFTMIIFVVMSGLAALINIVGLITYPNSIFEGYNLIFSGNRAHMGLFFLIGSGVSLFLFVQKRNIIFNFALLFNVIGVVLSASRAAQIGLFIMVALAVLATKDWKKIALMAVLSVIPIALVLLIAENRSNVGQTEIFGITMDTSTGFRFVMWYGAWLMLQSSPINWIIGVGYTNFRDVYMKMNIATVVPTNAAHNTYLNYLAELGLIGLILFLMIFFSLINLGYKYSKKGVKESGIFISFLFAIMSTGITQETLYPNEAFGNILVLFFLVASLMVLSMNQKFKIF